MDLAWKGFHRERQAGAPASKRDTVSGKRRRVRSVISFGITVKPSASSSVHWLPPALRVTPPDPSSGTLSPPSPAAGKVGKLLYRGTAASAAWPPQLCKWAAETIVSAFLKNSAQERGLEDGGKEDVRRGDGLAPRENTQNEDG